MKLKPLYIYLFLIFGALIMLIISSGNNDDSADNTTLNSESIPNDEIHKGMSEDLATQPSSSNVNKEIIDRMNEMEKSVAENPNDTLKKREYADLLAAAHQQDEAISLYNEIINIDPSRIDIYSNLAVLHYNKEDYLKSKEMIAKILYNDPDNTEALYNMGLIEARMGDIAAAKKQWEDLITNHPNTKMSDLAKEAIESL